MTTYDVFISYSRKDTLIADRICRAFDEAGITYFIDRQGIGGGQEFPVILADAIYYSKLFLFLASKNSYESKFTNNEILFAFNEKSHESILPYIIDNSDLPLHLRLVFASINWRNITDHPIESVLINDLLVLLGRYTPLKKKDTGDNDDRAIFLDGLKCDTPSDIVSYTAIKDVEEASFLDHYLKEAKRLYLSGNYKEALSYFIKAAERGSIEAFNQIAIIFDKGEGVDRDYEKAVEWFHKAAEKGFAAAQNSLGVRYALGKGVNKNIKEAAKWLRMAASQGDDDAISNLQLLRIEEK